MTKLQLHPRCHERVLTHIRTGTFPHAQFSYPERAFIAASIVNVVKGTNQHVVRIRVPHYAASGECLFCREPLP